MWPCQSFLLFGENKMIFNKMCSAVENIIQQIHDQPFNHELSQGILPKEKFIHYLRQDALYLSDYARALALTAARLANNDHAQQYIQFSQQAIKAERQHHINYINKNNLTNTLPIEQSPACFMYTNYLLKTASLASVEEAVSSLLPCFWVYREVGKNIAKKQKTSNPYHEWISLYSSEQFDASVNAAIDVTNQVGDMASTSIKEKMIAAFLRSTQLEWLFWDSAYHQETWLIRENKNIMECVA
jgi:thiaminase (transcriptional activator TenA)